MTVDGLQGGHSGAEIHKEHGNSNILMGRALCWLDEVVNFRIAGLSGGLMDNAIPRSTRAVLYVPEEECQAFEERLTALDAIDKTEYAASDAGVTVGFVSGRKGCRPGSDAQMRVHSDVWRFIWCPTASSRTAWISRDSYRLP